MLCTFCPLTILGDFLRIPEKSPKSSANRMHRACESKDQILKKIRTLHSVDCNSDFRGEGGNLNHVAEQFNLLDVSGIFYFFRSGGGEGGVRGVGREGFLENPRKGGGCFPGEGGGGPRRRGAEGPRRCLQGIRGGPKNLFGLFLAFRAISILQGYFWRPSGNTL